MQLASAEFRLIVLFLFCYTLSVPTLSTFFLLPLLSFVRLPKHTDLLLLIILAFTTSYHVSLAFFDATGDSSRFFGQGIGLVILYCIGLRIGVMPNKRIEMVLVATISGFFAFAFFSNLLTIINYPDLVAIRKSINIHYFLIGQTIEFNTPSSNLLLSLVSCFCLADLFVVAQNARRVLLNLLVVGASIAVSVTMLGRSTLVASCLFLALLLFINLKKRPKVTLAITGAFAFFWSVWFVLKLTLSEKVELPIINRFLEEGLETPRTKLWALGLSEVFIHPFGGNSGAKGGYSSYHNIWLDTADSGNLLSGFLLISAFLLALRGCSQLRSEIGQKIFYILFSFLIISFSEPVSHNSFYLFSYPFILFGIIQGLKERYNDAIIFHHHRCL